MISQQEEWKGHGDMTIFDTNFSNDYIEQLESILGSEWVNSATNIEDKVLYELKRLQARVQELECQLKSKQIVIESKEQTIREFAEKMLDLRKR